MARVCWTSEAMEYIHCGEWISLEVAVAQATYLNELFRTIWYWVELAS